MAENDQQIQIRSLSGESTQISIPHNCSIQDLKSLLTLIFPPAKSSPNFHLFFKGVKMSPKSTISDYSIGRDDIIVVVPFTKKNLLNNQSQPFDQVSAPSEASSSSNAADSVWSDLMQDLSFLSERNENTEELHRNVDTHLLDLNVEKKKVDESKNRLVSDIIGSGATGETGFGKIAEVLDSVNCMCDTKSGKCMSARILGCGSGKPCQCPVWLKKLLKTFSFLNIFSGFLEMQSLDVTWDRLSGAMKSLGMFGLEVCIEDLKQLSVICPKIVKCNIHGYEPMELGDAIVIVDSSVDVGNQSDLANNIRMVRKQVSTSTVVKAIKKREIIFKENLWWAVGNTLGKRKSGNRMKVFPSLEDLLTLMKDSDMAARCGETKRAKTKDITTSSSQSKQTRCHDMNSLLPVEMVEHLRKGIGSREQIVHVEEISARKAVHVDIPNEVSEPTRSALKRIGISMLYSHQAESIQASLSGKNVVVATMTSSGKSLCYNVPVLESLSQNLSSCALFLFPTKALAQDQIRALSVMTEGMDFSFNIGVYDGDTSQEDRLWLRDNARLLITNPDMLHMSILPFHTQFQRILSNLRFVVTDEAHTYKGAFGCHTALILRRLRRLCGHVYGSEPSFIFCTATSANPREHAMELAGLSELDLIEKDGSPSASKLFVLWNPPLYRKTVLKASDGADTSKTAEVEVRRSSPIMEVSSVFAEMVQHGLRCIAFCKTRKLCELVLSYTRDILKETAPTLVDSICSYRAGYTAQDRRRIESEFFGGKLRGVAATNALELGIDVGYIDATLHLGFPGSVSSLWQQAGRSGRRERPSLAVYIAFEGPLDQYFMKFPQKLFSRPIECCHVDAQNKQVLGQHLACAAVEHPLNLFHDEKYFGSGLSNSITSLATKGYLSSDPSRDSLAKIWSYIGHEKRPSHGVSIRAIETEKYKVIDKKTNEVIEEIEESKAFFQVYEGAVYMQQGKTYLVKDLDTIDKIAICEEANPKYYTKTRDYTDIHVLGGDFVYPVTQYSSTAQACTCKVTTTWFGFFCFARGSNQICGEAPLSLPKYSYESQAVWIRVPESVKTAVESHNLSFPAGLHAAGHAVLNVVPLFIQCNSSDLASECVNPHQILSANKGNMFRRKVPERILLYDKHPGGSGISAQVQPHFKELVVAALELLVTCQCFGETGCPSCVQILSCGEYNSCLHKDAAIMILKGIVRRE